jgi:hypothetical protein
MTDKDRRRADGFPHAGRLSIGDRTVVIANAVLARAVFRQATEIGTDCRIGNGAFVSHNCRIGARSLDWARRRHRRELPHRRGRHHRAACAGGRLRCG